MRPARASAVSIRVEDDRGRPLDIPSGKAVPAGSRIRVETPKYRATVVTEGYVSGVAAGSFEDRETGARDLGFGLAIADFLLEPSQDEGPIPQGQYEFGDKVHGRLAKRYVEGPQICTAAKRLPATVCRGPHFGMVTLRYQWTIPYPPHERAGSTWEQTLVFPEDEPFFLAADRVTTVASSPALFFRGDMPGHIRHERGMGFEHVYLSYQEPSILPSTEFLADFAPDEKFLYRRDPARLPERFIRAYQVHLAGGRHGPWLAGMTLDPGDVYQAWCHQRGYVCMIEEVGGRPTRPGDTFGACHLIGWFRDPGAMNDAYDRFRGISGLALVGPPDAPTGFRGLKREELTPLPT